MRSKRFSTARACRNVSLGIWLIFAATSPSLSAPPEEKEKSNFVIAIDVGHSKTNPGATSARGRSEYEFNRRIAEDLFSQLKMHGFDRSFLIEDLALSSRKAILSSKRYDLLLSIHHDSVQPQYLSCWFFEGKKVGYCDKYKGFSIFLSERNQNALKSRMFASLVADEFIKKGFVPSLHHAEPIPGENRELVDRERGIYKFDQLAILGMSNSPAILVECGIIVNRAEEASLSDFGKQAAMVSALLNAIESYILRNQPPSPAKCSGIPLLRPHGMQFRMDVLPFP